jgi:hypothetical protein
LKVDCPLNVWGLRPNLFEGWALNFWFEPFGFQMAYNFDLTLLLSLYCFGVEAFTTTKGFSEGLPCNFWLSTFCFQILATFCFQLSTLNNSFAFSFKVGDCFAFNFLLSTLARQTAG